ncbi:hypothetical protein ACF063_11770 [Streptomyces chartreusis]|uniref:hypothetical protein n=1 Tax=Streptomyces chartreusis TaxID=1969 RepID=UPI0037017E42
MNIALYVRETLELSDATQQRLLRFARTKGVVTGGTLVIAVRTLTAIPGYVFDLRDPAEPSYLLNLVLVVDDCAAPGLTINMAGASADTSAEAGHSGRSAQVFARHLRQELTVIADGGTGGTGLDGSPGADEIVSVEIDDRGKPHREYEPAIGGAPGGSGGAGGPGGVARVFWSSGASALVTAVGGAGGAAGKGGKGGKGAPTAQGRPRPGAPDGSPGQPGPTGLAGTAVAEGLSPDKLWLKVREERSNDLAVAAIHWLRTAEFRYRQTRGVPTAVEADMILGLLDLVIAADPLRLEAAALKAQFVNGDNLLGLPRNLDVVADFERFRARLESESSWIEGLFGDAKALLTATAGASLTESQLQVQLATLDFTSPVLEAARADAQDALTVATVEQKAADARWVTALQEVRKRKVELEEPIDWGGIVVVGLFAVVGLIVSAYVGEHAGKIIGSIPDLMTLGNVNFSGSDDETKVLKDAVVAGGELSKIRSQGLKEAAGHQKDGQIDIDAWAGGALPVLVSFAKLVQDIDEAAGDPELKQLVKDLALRLQESLAAKAKVASAQRQLQIAVLRAEGLERERAAYAQLHSQARSDVALMRETALSLLHVVRRYGDVFLDYQVRAARAVEIYARTDQSAALRLDRWHVHPDIELDFEQNLIDPVEFQSRLLATNTELAVVALTKVFDAYDLSGFKGDVHYVTIDDPGWLAAFRQNLVLSVVVANGDLAGDRWEAKTTAAAVTLSGVTAETPTFPVVVTHGPRCTERLKDGTEVTQYLQPRSTFVQVAVQEDTAAGAVATPVNTRPTDFWRRSIATEWSLSIEADVAKARHVDLTGLTRIQLALGYIAKAPQP